MADERYQWLDQEAAERLLRGEPVDALDDPARIEAGRLAEALDAARTPTAALAGQTELPGEAAALAAFRRATSERAAHAERAAHGAHAAHAERVELGRVRIAPVAAPVRRWGRSVRYGLAAAVAAVTVGGVAVAAGTGMLPMVGPEPAASVTAGESPDAPTVTGTPGIRKDPEVPPVGPDGGAHSPGSSPTAGGSASPASPSTSPFPSLSTPPDPRHTPNPGRTTSRPGGDKGTSGPTAKEKALQACRDYRAGRLDSAGNRELSSTLRGETLRRYCDRILGSGGTGASADPQEDGKKDDGKSDDGKDDDGKGDGKSDDGKSDDGKGDRRKDAGAKKDDGGSEASERRNRGSGHADRNRRGALVAPGVTLFGPSAQY
ncbi:hypothetical protein ACI2LO_30380 [Streptomyces sp. NPDC033754]|uniref:hypothetical protein n=1 Tax=unclassified Streptomyces TaxID=2593676 RepID=UPI0033CE75BC